MRPDVEFDYSRAYARNIGLLTEAEQVKLRHATVALPGLGGVGGFHLELLARLGVGGFRLADLDAYEMGNIHRQIGATVDSLGRLKTEVMAQRAKSINPEVRLQIFAEGVHERNLDEFLVGVDLVVDGMEFFAFGTRSMIFKRALALGIPVITAGPIGYGAALLTFLPKGPSLEQFFGINSRMTTVEKLLCFAAGLNPRLGTDIDPQSLDFENRRGPALSSACALCSSLAATEAFKILLDRGKKAEAPRGVYIDPYRLQIRSLKRNAFWSWLKRKLVVQALLRKIPSLRLAHEAEIIRNMAT